MHYHYCGKRKKIDAAKEDLLKSGELYDKVDNGVVEPSDDFVKHIQEMMKEKSGKDVSFEEAWEGAYNLLGFFDLLLKIDRRIGKNNKKSGKSLHT